MHENDKFKKIKLNSQNTSMNFIDSLNKTKFEQLKEISQKTKIKINSKYQNRNAHLITTELPPKKSNKKLKNYVSNTKTDYSKYNKVPHKTKKLSNINLDYNDKNDLFPDRVSDTQSHNYHIKKELNNLFLDTEINFQNTINISNNLKKCMNDDENKYMISKILKSKVQNKINKTKNEKLKPKIKILVDEKKISLIKNIQNTRLKNQEANTDNLIKKFLILNNGNKNNYNINDNSKILYIIDDEQNNIYNNKNYSNKNDYDFIMNNKIDKNFDEISFELLKMNERRWVDELDDISNFLINNREILDDNIFNKYVRQLIKIKEHFNFLVNSIAKYFDYLFYENITVNFKINNIDLPKYENIWFKGFKWKGLFIHVIPQHKSKFIINEIKSLNYFFLDYMQIIESYKNFQHNKNPLSNYLIFPLISYCEINGFILYASTIINLDQNLLYDKSKLNDIKNIIIENKGYIQFYSNLNDSSFYYLNINKNNQIIDNKELYYKNKLFIHSKEKLYDIKDLSASKLFSEINIYHFIEIQKEKFMIFNVNEFIPSLFLIKNNSIINLYMLSASKSSTKISSSKFDVKSKKMLDNNINQEPIIQNILKGKINSTIKKKDLFLNGIHFRILYETQNINNRNYKNKNFVDYLFNYEKKSIKEKNNFNILKYEKNINEPYIILYDLIEPIKLKYSLIKKSKINFFNKKKNDKESPDTYIKRTDYISYFMSWCKMINNNAHIKSYYGLKRNMEKYGIDTNLKHLLLLNLNNKDIIDIIKISFLIKAIKYTINKKENDNLFNNLNNNDSNIFSSKLSLNNKSFNEIRKEMILYGIQSILYPNEILSINKTFFEIFYQNLVFYTKIMFIKFKLIDDYIFVNKQFNIKKLFSSNKIFLKQIIKSARKKPFLFIKELQFKLNFILNPYILFKSSLSIESMKNQLEKKHIHLNSINIHSYINNEEISGLVLTKLIFNSESLEKKMNDKNFANKSIKLGDKFNIEIKGNINHLYSFNYYDNESHNSTYDSKKNNVGDYDNITLLTSKLNISDSLTQIPKIKEEYDILYENNFFSEIINDLLKNFIIQLQPNCYKMKYNCEDLQKSSDIYNRNKENSDFAIYKDLKESYKISNIQILYNWFEYQESIFSNIQSFNGSIQHLLLKSFILKFIFSFFIEKSIEKSKIILLKIKEIYKNVFGYMISLNDLGLIFLLEGLIKDKNEELSFKEKESLYSKSLILFLMCYGDPRGRKNDSNEILLLPILKIMNKIYEIEKDSLIYDYFKEMYLSLDYNIKNKKNKNSENQNNDNTEFNYLNFKNKKEINISNNEIKKELFFDSLILGYKNQNNHKEKNCNMNHLNFLSNYNFKDSLNDDYLNNFYSSLFKIDESININNSNINTEKTIFSKEFILYFMKLVQNSMINERGIIFDEKYINENITDDLFVQNNEHINIKEIKKNNNNKFGFFKKSSSQKGIQIIKTEDKENKSEIKNIHKNNSEKFIKRTNSGLYNNFSHFLYRELLQKLSYKLNAPSGVVISFGNNSHYETGLDKTNLVTVPHIIFKLKNKIIRHIYAGWEHNLLIDTKGKVFSFGHNQCFQCGYPNLNGQESIKDPKNITKNNKIIAISASCGNEHSLILSNEHIVYSFGSNEDGILGINLNHDSDKEIKVKNSERKKIKSYKFNKIDFGEYTNKIIEISSGTVHNLALTYNGKIFSWGSAQGGQLGISIKELLTYPGFKNNYFIRSPILIPISKDKNINIIKVSCGEAHSLALTNKGKVYSWGFGSNGQLGLGFCEDSFEPGEGLKNSMRYKPEIIEALDDEKICHIKCGKTFSMFVDNKGELFACGVNDLYQLGIQENPPKEHLFDKDEDSCYDFVSPTKVDYFLKMKVKNIACGEGHCLAIIKDLLSNTETIWSWGNNKFGQLGQNIFIKRCLPRPINCLFEYNFFKFDEVACGGFHSLVLIKHHKDTNWIEDDYNEIICTLIDDIGII